MTDDVIRRTLNVRRNDIRDELAQIDDALEDLAQERADKEATFLREGRREIDALIAREWGPPIRGNRQHP